MTNEYNRWKNYETLAAILWLSNDQDTDAFWKELAREAYRDADTSYGRSRRQVARADLADRLQNEIEESTPVLRGLFADLLDAALSEIDWHAVADGYLTDIGADDDEQTE